MGDLFQEFSDLTGCHIAEAQSWLEAYNYDTAEAVTAFLDGKSKPSTSNGRSSKREYEDEIRAPDEIKRQQLISSDDQNILLRGVLRRKEKAPPVAFAVGGAVKGSKADQLANLYKRPTEIMHNGTFYEARHEAKDTDKWLLVNIQKEGEFACQTLNRDVWADEFIKEIIACHFVFWQQQDGTSEAKTYGERYHVNNYPHVAIINPRTSQSFFSRDDGRTYTKIQWAEMIQDFLGQHPAPSELRYSSSADSVAAHGISFNQVHEIIDDDIVPSGSKSSFEDKELTEAIRVSNLKSQSKSPSSSSDEVIVINVENERKTGDGCLISISENDLKDKKIWTGFEFAVSFVDKVDVMSAAIVAINKLFNTVPEAEALNFVSLKDFLGADTGYELSGLNRILETITSSYKLEVQNKITAASTKILLRLPSGKRAEKVFLKGCSVFNLVKFAAQQLKLDSPGTKSFDLQYCYPTKSLSEAVRSKLNSNWNLSDVHSDVLLEIPSSSPTVISFEDLGISTATSMQIRLL